MFEELNYSKTINRFKANKGIKFRRESKHDETWKRLKNIALHRQSQRENKFDEDTLEPERHLSRWEQREEQHRLQNMYPLGAGW